MKPAFDASSSRPHAPWWYPQGRSIEPLGEPGESCRTCGLSEDCPCGCGWSWCSAYGEHVSPEDSRVEGVCINWEPII